MYQSFLLSGFFHLSAKTVGGIQGLIEKQIQHEGYYNLTNLARSKYGCYVAP